MKSAGRRGTWSPAKAVTRYVEVRMWKEPKQKKRRGPPEVASLLDRIYEALDPNEPATATKIASAIGVSLDKVCQVIDAARRGGQIVRVPGGYLLATRLPTGDK